MSKNNTKTPQNEDTHKWHWKMDWLIKRKYPPADFWDMAENAYLKYISEKSIDDKK